MRVRCAGVVIAWCVAGLVVCAPAGAGPSIGVNKVKVTGQLHATYSVASLGAQGLYCQLSTTRGSRFMSVFLALGPGGPGGYPSNISLLTSGVLGKTVNLNVPTEQAKGTARFQADKTRGNTLISSKTWSNGPESTSHGEVRFRAPGTVTISKDGHSGSLNAELVRVESSDLPAYPKPGTVITPQGGDVVQITARWNCAGTTIIVSQPGGR